MSAVFAALVGVFFGLTGPVTLTSNGQLLLPASDPVNAQGPTASKPESSLIGIQLKTYAGGDLKDDVRRQLKEDAALLDSFSAVRQRDPIFYRISASAKKGRVAKDAVQAGADLMIAKAAELSKAQVDKLQALVTQRLGPLDQQSAAAAADQLTKQATVDNIQKQVASLQGQADAAREAAARAAVSGKGSASTGSAIASSVQSQLDALNKQLIPAQAALEQAKSKAAVIDAQRQGLQDQVQKATDNYLTTQVASSLAAPPSRPISGRKLRFVSLVMLEALVGLVTAGAVIAWRERRQLARMLRRNRGAAGRRPAPSLSGLGTPAPAPAHAARSRR
jgi:hypothetical protein